MTPSPSVLPIHLVRHQFECGACIPAQPNVLWQIEAGIVRTQTWHSDGTLITLGLWGKGSILGEALSHLEPYAMECMTAVTASILPPVLWEYAIDSIFEHIHCAEELLHVLHCRPIPLRLRLLLHWLAERFGTATARGISLDIRLTHQQIADLAGTTRTTVSRLFKQFERAGTIAYDRGCLILRDPLRPL